MHYRSPAAVAHRSARAGRRRGRARLALRVLAGSLALATVLHPAQPAEPAERFRVVTGDTPAALERRLQAASSDGFHLLAAARGTSLSGKGQAVVLLERVASGRPPAKDGPPAKDAPQVEYAVIATSGDLAAGAAGELLEKAAAGFRLSIGGVLPDSPDDWWLPPADYESQVWLIVERRGAGDSYAYDSFGYETDATFAPTLARRLDEGYEVLGILNSARRLRILLERDLRAGVRPEAPPIAPEGRYRMLLGSRKLGVRMQLNDAAAKGYRLAGIADASTIAPPMILVEKAASPMDAHTYRTLYEPDKKIYKDNLARKLNKRARKGLRVVKGGITAAVVVLEQSDVRVEYRTLSSRGRPGLAEQLGDAAAAGFAPIALFVNGGEATVVVERELPGA